ncbi:hypothetical protein NDU88_001810 [Pleurodeles waltl]|uniref:Uncharacterized protein n=1 Tax=Pleurodeles waltl TaxID=8319 RepID=A0AAV7R9M7_PLEWA|nr:hypothetical protein NDU88_001810 [Pleurodeles waltl]
MWCVRLGAWPSRRARWPTRREALPGPRPLILFNLSCRRLRRVRTLGELSGDPSDSLVGRGVAGTEVRRPAPREQVWRRQLPARADADCVRGEGEALRLLPASGELWRAYLAATSSRGTPPPGVCRGCLYWTPLGPYRPAAGGLAWAFRPAGSRLV